MSDEENKWSRPDAPPPPLFFNEKERDLVKQVNDELIERVVGQEIVYYPISLEHTDFHPMYEEAITKTFLPPIHVYVLIEWGEPSNTTVTTGYGIDKMFNLQAHFHRKRLNEDQNINVQEGDFILYDGIFYEIVRTSQPRRLFGQDNHQLEITAQCVQARAGAFNAE